MSKRRIIGLCGYSGAGKDAAAAALVACGWVRQSFADSIRNAALAIDPIVLDEELMDYRRLSAVVRRIGWRGAKKFCDTRMYLQNIGVEAGRNIHGEGCWMKIVLSAIAAMPYETQVVITDVRFENEVAMVRDLGGKVIWIERPGVGPVNEHVSDAGLSALKEQADAQILNDGTLAELHERIVEAVR